MQMVLESGHSTPGRRAVASHREARPGGPADFFCRRPWYSQAGNGAAAALPAHGSVHPGFLPPEFPAVGVNAVCRLGSAASPTPPPVCGPCTPAGRWSRRLCRTCPHARSASLDLECPPAALWAVSSPSEPFLQTPCGFLPPVQLLGKLCQARGWNENRFSSPDVWGLKH